MLQLDNSRLLHNNNRIITDMSILPISGLLMWFDASYINLPNLSRISNVSDRSGNGYDLIQTDVNRRPLLRNSVLNSKPVIEFDINTLLDPVNPSMFMVTRKSPYLFFNNMTVENFIIGRFMTPVPINTQALFLRTRDGLTSQPIIRHLAINQLQRAVSNVIDNNGLPQNVPLNINLNPSQWYLFYMKQEFKPLYTRTLTIDGVGTNTLSSIANITMNSRSTTTLSNNSNQVVIQMAEVITTSTDTGLSGFDVSYVTNYLKQKYNLI